jgi:ArsR family transcriptional regulator
VDVLRVLQRDSFGVLELATILDVPQPALSHHLKLLLEAGLLTKRREGTSIFYRRTVPPANGAFGTYLAAALAVIDEVRLASAVRNRVKKVHAERGHRSREFFRSHAAEFAEQQALVCAPDVYLGAIEAAIERAGAGNRAALDVGVGTGESLAMLSRRFKRVLGVDESAAMLERARERIAPLALDNVTLRHTDVGGIRGTFDLVLMSMVVHHAPSPVALFRHARKLMAPRGLLLVVELCTHEQAWTREACGDVWLGFEPEELDGWARTAVLDVGESEYLAQRNGFRIQIRSYRRSTDAQYTSHPSSRETVSESA